MGDSPFFQDVPKEEIERVLATARRRRFSTSEVVFHEGDPGDSLHVIVEGHFAVRVTTPYGDVATLVVLDGGEIFGEMALLAVAARSNFSRRVYLCLAAVAIGFAPGEGGYDVVSVVAVDILITAAKTSMEMIVSIISI